MNETATVKCLTCKDIVQSAHQDDFGCCSCFQESTDAIESYMDILEFDLEVEEDDCEEVEEHLRNHFGTGIAIEGGMTHTRMIIYPRSDYIFIKD